jgi:hypothetical protein
MGFTKNVAVALQHPYFLYFMAFVAATNVLGFLVTRQWLAIVCFGLLALVTSWATQEKALILLAAVLGTHLWMSSSNLQEGLQNALPSSSTPADPSTSPMSSTPSVSSKATVSATPAPANGTVLAVPAAPSVAPVKDSNNPSLNQVTSSPTDPQPAEESVSKPAATKKSGTKSAMSNRVDFASSAHTQYQHLEKMLGSPAIQQLSSDTKDLMTKQQELFHTMNSMVPMLEGAQSMLEKFNIPAISQVLASTTPGV